MKKAKQLPHWLPWFMVFLGAVFYCYEYILRLMPSVMEGELMRAFDISYAGFGLMSAAYYLGYVPSSVIVGPILDKYLPRRVIILALVTCIIGCGIFAVAHNVWVAGFARFVIGFASAFGFIGVLKIGAMWLPKHRFGAVAGLASFLGMMTAMVGQNGLSQMMVNLSWQQLYIQSGLVGAIILALFVIVLRDSKPKFKPQSVSAAPTSSSSGMKQLLKSRPFWLNGLIGCTTFLPIVAFAELWGIPYIEHSYLLPRQDAAFYNSMVYFGWAIGGPCFGLIYDATQNWGRTLFWGTFGALFSIGWLLYLPVNELGLPVLLFLFGFFGSSHVLAFISGRILMPGRDGTALAMTNFMIMMGGMIFQPFIGGAIDLLSLYAKLPQNTLYEVAMSVIPLGLVATLFLVVKVQKQLTYLEAEPSFGPTRKLAY